MTLEEFLAVLKEHAPKAEWIDISRCRVTSGSDYPIDRFYAAAISLGLTFGPHAFVRAVDCGAVMPGTADVRQRVRKAIGFA